MKSARILEEEIRDMKISALPTYPTAPKSYGGVGYSAADMKAAFDRLPLYIIARFNALIDDIESASDDSVAGAIPTGISEGHTLAALFSDIRSGALASYLDVGGTALAMRLAELEVRIAALEGETDGENADASEGENENEEKIEENE